MLPSDYDFEQHKELVPMQAGDVPITYADTSALEICDELKNMDVTTFTPIEAMNALYKLSEKAKKS